MRDCGVVHVVVLCYTCFHAWWSDTRSPRGMIRGRPRHQPGWFCCWPSCNWQWNGRFNLVYEDFIFECKLTLKHARFQRGNNSNNHRDNFVAREGCKWRYNVSLLFIIYQKVNLEETEGSFLNCLCVSPSCPTQTCILTGRQNYSEQSEP